MAANITRIPILKRPPLHKLFTSLMSDQDLLVFVPMTLGLEDIKEKRPVDGVLYARRELISIERLHRDRRSNEVVFAGAAYTKHADGWRRKYRCAGRLFLSGRQTGSVGWLVDTESSEFFTDCTDSPLPMLWWRRAMQEGHELVNDLVGDYVLGDEVVRHTVNTLSRGMRRLPNICPECGSIVTRSEWGMQLATCPVHGQLDYGGDLVIAIGKFEEAFGIK